MKTRNFIPRIFLTTAMSNKFDNFGAAVPMGFK